MVNNVSNSGCQNLADLKAYLEDLKTKRDNAKETKSTAEDNKTNAETSKSTAESDKTNSDNVKTQAEIQKSMADESVTLAEQVSLAAADRLKIVNDYVTGALNALNNALSAEPQNETTVHNARVAYDRAIEQQKAAQNAVKEAEEGLQKAREAQQKAAEALEKAEREAEDAAIALEEAISALDNAIVELDEAVETLEAAEAEVETAEIELEEAEAAEAASTGSPIMSEEEAIKAGYTIIKTYEDLLKIGDNLGGKYILMGDIEIPDGVNWTPIGDANSPFTGEFNGNGCNIKNLNITVTQDNAENVGFFGVTDGATIRDLTFVDAKVNGKTDYLDGTTNVGILAGCVRGTTIIGVNVTGDSSVTGYASVGGLIGAVDDHDDTGVSIGNSYIEDCHTNVNVHAKYAAGGLIGYVTSSADRMEDHRGIANKSLIIRNCSTSGSAIVDDESVGGIIGETGKTIVTLDNCSSDMSLTWTNDDGLGDLSFLLETGRIGGLVGNINGTYITFANCGFNGSLNGDTEFQSDIYGWYMDDAHVSIYDLPDGLPVNDILNITGIDGMTQIGDGKYLCTVSTMTGLDKMIAMLKEHPEYADMIEWQINFDFDAMNGEYDYSEYAQYGIVQHLYEDEDGNVVNDTYIDNECDLETTYHSSGSGSLTPMPCSNCNSSGIEPTMIPGLYKDLDDDYVFIDSDGQVRKLNITINADGQITNVTKRLTSSEVAFRERLVELGKKLQQQIRDILKAMYNWEDDLPILTKAEYKKLLKKAEKYGYDSLTDEEKLGMAVFEADYDIMNAQAKYTKNLGCAMGGEASFLDKTTTYQMYDENGNALYTTLEGDRLIMDENGNYAYADGSGPYYGMAEVFEQRGYQNTDENGNLLFTHTAEDGTVSVVTQIKDEDGNVSYVTTDAEGNQIPFEGDIESLERQLTEANYADDYANFEDDLNQILQDAQDGKYPKGMNEETDNTEDTGDTDEAITGEVVEPSESEPEDVVDDILEEIEKEEIE